MDKLQSQKRSRKLHYYFLFNFLLSLFLAMPYFGNLEINSDNLFHIALSFGSNFLGLYMLMALILYPFYRFIPSNRFVQGIAVFLMIVLNLFIFLDVNMPGMNGWEFLEAYNALPANQKGRILVFMLTTSLDPEDEGKSLKLGANGFIRKPLTPELVVQIAKEYFPENFWLQLIYNLPEYVAPTNTFSSNLTIPVAH